MGIIEPGDYIKAEFKDERTGESEWMWVRVEFAEDRARVVFGWLDNEPVVNTDLRREMRLFVSYDNIREHMKAAFFRQ